MCDPVTEYIYYVQLATVTVYINLKSEIDFDSPIIQYIQQTYYIADNKLYVQ